jgi:hypothetical protein
MADVHVYPNEVRGENALTPALSRRKSEKEMTPSR